MCFTRCRQQCGSLLLLFWMAFATLAAPRPNVVLLLTDDQRFDTIRRAGNRVIQTPHLDRLAADGILFRQAFVTTPICCTSRASLLTGQYARRHRIDDFATDFRPEQWSQTYPAQLRSVGYRTGFIGKFGVGTAAAIAAREKDFDFWRGRPGQAGVLFIEPGDPKQQHATARFGDEALEFLKGCRRDQPFCLSVSFNAPHARDGQAREFQPDPRDEALYRNVTIPPPPTATAADFERMVPWVQNSESRRRWEKRFATPEMAQSTLRDYYRLITGVDREVGRVRTELQRLGFADSTVIVFTSDNGFFLGEHGLADKWYGYEESLRVPLMIYDPRLPRTRRGRTEESLVLNIDLAPTVLTWAGLSVPEAMQGRDLSALLIGNRPERWRTDFYFEHHFGPNLIPPSEGIRDERWTYIRWLPPNPSQEELYDLTRDPLQRTNVVDRPDLALQLNLLRERAREAAHNLQ
ncbi:MAG: sulfatase [Verrucomicrobia bacterium]|nr:sulfatase [Verrucomicrobiota bacterium]